MSNYTRFPQTAGGIKIYPSVIDFPSIAQDGQQAVAADTNTIYIYDTSTSTWVAVATPGASIAITGLIDDVSATGPGVASATVNSVGGASAVDIAQSVADTQAAVSNPIVVDTLAKRDSTGRCDFSEIQMYSPSGGPTSVPSVYLDYTEIDVYGPSGDQVTIYPTQVQVSGPIGSSVISSGGQIETHINLQAPTDPRDYSFKRVITCQAGTTASLSLDKITVSNGDLSQFYGNETNITLNNVTGDYENALINNNVTGAIAGYLSNAEIYNNFQTIGTGVYNYYIQTGVQTLNGVYWPLWFGASFNYLNNSYAGLTLQTSATNMTGNGVGVKHLLTVGDFQGSDVTGFSETSSIISTTPGSYSYAGLKVQPTLANAGAASGVKVDMSNVQGSNVLAVDATGADIYVLDGKLYSEIYNTSTSPARLSNLAANFDVEAGLSFSGPSKQVDLSLTANPGSVIGGIITLESTNTFDETNSVWNMTFSNNGNNVYSNIKNLEFSNYTTDIAYIDNILISNQHTTLSVASQPIKVLSAFAQVNPGTLIRHVLTETQINLTSGADVYQGMVNNFYLSDAQGTEVEAFRDYSNITSATVQGLYSGLLITPTLSNVSDAVGSKVSMTISNCNATEIVGFLENSSISGPAASLGYAGLKVNPSISGGDRVRGIEVDMTSSTGVDMLAMELTGDAQISGNTYLNGGIRVKSDHNVSSSPVNVQLSQYYIGINTSVARTVNLPAAATAGAGKMYVFKDETGNAATNNITIDPNGAELIDGAASYVMAVNRESITIICTGTGWQII